MARKSQFSEIGTGLAGLFPAEAPQTEAAPPPGHLGHRARMRSRLLTAGPEGILDHELLEMLLFQALPRRDTKPIARALLALRPELLASRREVQDPGAGHERAQRDAGEVLRQRRRRLAREEAHARHRRPVSRR